MKNTGKIILIMMMIAFAFTSVFAKPVNHDMALSDLKKPLSMAATTSRPTRDHQYLTPGGHFIIHYDNDGIKSVPQDYTFNDSIPDFVFKGAEYLDDSYSMLHDSLGYNAPPTDNIESPEIDIYFYIDGGQNSSWYGSTQLESDIGNGKYISYLSLSTLLNDSTIFYTCGLEGLRVTCAHELFHIFQLGYRYRYEDIFYFEMSSVWFEEYMYPEVNDYHAYVNEYARDWNYKLNHDNLDYDNAGFNLYLHKRFSSAGGNIIRSIWNRIITVNAMTAIRNELDSRGSSLEEALNNWGCSQVLCGPFSSPAFQYALDDAEDLETISFDRNTDHILYGLSDDIALTKTPVTSYFKLTGIPNSLLLFQTIFDEGVVASLIGLNGTQSKVYPIGSKPIVIDGRDYNNYILVLGSDAPSANGSYAFTAVQEDQLAALYPNPLSPGKAITLSYVLLEENQSGRLSIYDLNGRNIYSNQLADIYLASGLHEFSFIPPSLSSGIYIVALHFESTKIVEKFTYLK